jgi:hypothetical protein
MIDDFKTTNAKCLPAPVKTHHVNAGWSWDDWSDGMMEGGGQGGVVEAGASRVDDGGSFC